MSIFGAVALLNLCSAVISLPAAFNDIFQSYFAHEPTIQAYLCNWQDALDATKYCSRGESSTCNVKKLASSQCGLGGISMGPKHPQRMGIFVDIRCPHGKLFLTQSSNFFNATYSWLIWAGDIEDTLELLNTSRVAVDSQVAIWLPIIDSAVLIDVYRYHVSRPLIMDNLTIPTSDCYPLSLCSSGRNDFQGFRMTASGVLLEFPWEGRGEFEDRFMDPTFAPNVAGVRRYSYSMFYLMSKIYNFDFDIKMYTFWHTTYRNGTSTGMLKDILEGERDFGIAPGKYISERLGNMSFLGVLGSVRFTFVFRQPSAQGSITALVAPMSSSAWCGLAIACFVCGLVIWVILIRDGAVKTPYKGSESFLMTLSAISQISLTEMGSRPSTQVALISTLVMSYLANILYNSSVLNGLLIKAPDAIQNVHQLIKSDLKIISNDVGYLRDQMASNDTVSQEFQRKMMKNDNPYLKLEEGLKMVRSGQYAFYVLDEDFYRAAHHLFSVEEICTISDLPKERSFPTGMYGVRNSPYREHYRRGLNLLQESGIQTRLSRLFRAYKPDCEWNLEAVPFGLKPVSLAYFVFLAGIAISIFIFTFERLYKILRRQTELKY